MSQTDGNQGSTSLRTVLTTHSEIVHAPIEVAWAGLVEKVGFPDKFVPGAKVDYCKPLDADTLEKATTFERLMHIGPRPIHENIFICPVTRTVLFVHHPSHPLLEGYVINQLYPLTATTCRMEYTLSWALKEGKELPPGGLTLESLPVTIIDAVKQSKKVIEERSH
jgi:hypothetical protein